MISKYSVVFMPPKDILADIKTMKAKLAEKIGWYNSKNASAHITICEFHATEKELLNIEQQLKFVCNYLKPEIVIFDHFGFYEQSGAFFIAPNNSSKEILSKMTKEISQHVKTERKYSSSTPHMSIARKLTREKLEICGQLFTEINIDFLCKSIFLRQFDFSKKQYTVRSEFLFKSQQKPESGQQSLFLV